MQGLQRLDEVARATWEARTSNGWKSPLPGRVCLAADAYRLVHVVGGGGTGKSFLLRKVTDILAGSSAGWDDVVLTFRGHAGFPISAAGVLDALHGMVRQQDGLCAATGPSGAHIVPAVGTAVGWWGALADANPGVRFTLVLDALEEIDGLDGGVREVLPWAHDRYRIIVATRPRPELPACVVALVDALAESGGHILDLDAYYAGDEGREDVAGYLRKCHTDVSHADVLAGSRRGGTVVFLHAFHLARGYEVGFMPPPSGGAQRWSYGDYLAWMEARVHGHPGYVHCLRAILLTLADAPFAINERTLRALMGAPRAEAVSRGPGFMAWQPWVLRDLEDFIARRRLPAAPTSLADAEAAGILSHDASLRPVDGSVLEPAHIDLRRHLRSADLPEGWQQVREELRQVRRNLVEEVLACDAIGTSSEERYAFSVAGPEACVVGGTLDITLLHRWRRHVPVTFVGAVRPSYWVAALRRVLELAPPAALAAEFHLSLGRALDADLSSSAALEAYGAAVARARTAGGIEADTSGSRLIERVAAAPEVASTLAAALEAIGRHHAVRNRRDGVAACAEALEVRRCLRRLAPGVQATDLAYADALALHAFASTRTGSVARMMVTRSAPALHWVGEAAGIYAHHLGLSQPVTVDDAEAAAASDVLALRGLIAVLTDGLEVANVYREVDIALGIASDIRVCVDGASTRMDAENGGYSAIRPLVNALVGVANVLQRADRPSEAVEVYEATMALLAAPSAMASKAAVARERAGLLLGFNEQHLGLARAYRDLGSHEACERAVREGVEAVLSLATLDGTVTDDELVDSISRRPDTMKTLVVALLEAAKILRTVPGATYAQNALDLAVRVTRAWSDLDPEASDERRREVARTSPWAYQALCETLEQCARVRMSRGDRTSARTALCECEVLIRLAGHADYPYMPELDEPSDADPDASDPSDAWS